VPLDAAVKRKSTVEFSPESTAEAQDMAVREN
jgi:hypothetical protein